jgi:hypothetical protein
MKLTSRISLTIIALFFFLFAASCDNKKGETDFETLQVIYLILNRTVDLQVTCESSQGSAFQCATDSTIPGATELYVSTMESIYLVLVDAPRDETALCSALLDADTFPDPTNDGSKTYSPGSKECYLNCQKDYWDRMQSEGKCTATDYPGLSPFDDETYQECLTDCFTEGTILPP